LSRELDSYTYAGDSKADLPIWKAADSAVFVDFPDSVSRQNSNRESRDELL